MAYIKPLPTVNEIYHAVEKLGDEKVETIQKLCEGVLARRKMKKEEEQSK